MNSKYSKNYQNIVLSILSIIIWSLVIYSNEVKSWYRATFHPEYVVFIKEIKDITNDINKLYAH